MALSAKQMSAVTLAEFEELATRFAAALSVLREAQALMGPAAIAAPAGYVAEPQGPTTVTPTVLRSVQTMTREQAEAAAAVDENAWRQGLSDEQQAELETARRSPERAALLAGIRGTTA